VTTLNNVIFMNDRTTKNQATKAGVRDRRYAIRFPFAADVELIDMESGARVTGVTSDLSLGGCFVCTSKPVPIGTRIRMTLTRNEDTVVALAVVRILKPRIGMGVEFIDVEAPCHEILTRWLEQVRRNR
jgi:PilZ domain